MRPGGTYQNGSIYSDTNYGMLFRSARTNPTLATFSFANTSDAKIMTMLDGGNVGIGTTSPSQKLVVAGSAVFASNDNGAISVDGAGRMGLIKKSGFESMIAGAGGYPIVFAASNQTSLFNNISTSTLTELMRINANGNVGIGTTSPSVKLDVIGSSNLSMIDNGYSNFAFTQSGTTWTATGTFGSGGGIETFGMEGAGNFFAGHTVITPVGIRADGWIATARGLIVYSDRRIKRDMHASPTAQDLATIQQLKVTDYRMVDPADGGMAWRKGFIAQELEKVIPGAVTRSVEFVPEIFSVATGTVFDPAAKTLGLTLPKDHNLKVGDRVRLHMDGKRLDLQVSALPSARTFVVADCPAKPEKVLVYGKQVQDFRTVDYDRIFTTAVGALQELKKEKDADVAELRKKNDALQVANTRLAARVAELEARDKARDAKLVAIEKLLLSADQPAARTVSLKTGAGAE